MSSLESRAWRIAHSGLDLDAALLRQRPRGVEHHLSADAAVMSEGSATAIVTRGLRTDAPLDEQVQQVKRETDEARIAAAAAQAAADRALAAVERTRAYVDQRDAAVQAAINDRARTETVEGIPLAVVGLAATALGTALQYVAGFFG